MKSLQKLQDALHALVPLRRVLAEEHTGMALVSVDGTWHLEQNGAVRYQKDRLSPDAAQALVEAVDALGSTGCLDHWWVRPIGGGGPATLLFERRPTPDSDGLSRLTLDLLRSRLNPGANGLIFGNARGARSSILLSLIRFLPTDLVLYVGPVPPMEPADTSLVHIPPPRHDRDRREMATLFERSSAVLFDGPVQAADIRLLFSGADVRNRWLAVDATTPAGGVSSFDIPPHLEEPLNTRIGVRGTPAKKVRLTYFSRKQGDRWQVLLDQENLHDGEISTVTVDEETTVRDPESGEDPLSHRMTSPIDHRRDQESVEAPTNPETTSMKPGARSASPAPPEDLSAQAQIDAEAAAKRDSEDNFDVQTLLGDEDSEPTEVPRESGEIDVPGFVSRRQQQARRDSEADEIADAPTDMLQGKRIDDDLPGLVASSDIDEVEIPGLTPEQLRRTYEGPADVKSLKEKRSKEDPQKEPAPSKDDKSNGDDDSPRQTRKLNRMGRRKKSTSKSQRSTSQSGQWRKAPSSSHRVIPVPSENKRAEKATAELGQISADDLEPVDSDEASDEPPTDELTDDESQPITTEVLSAEDDATVRTGISQAHADVLEERLSDSVDHTAEVNIGDVLEDLRKKRADED